MTRTVSLGFEGFVVSADREGLLGRLLNNIVLGGRGAEIPTLFAPDGEGFWIPSIGGALRIDDRDTVRPPYDEDPALDPDLVELWSVERERPFHAPLQIVLTGDELRALLAEAQRLADVQRG